MPNPYFQFKHFTLYQDQCAMKVTTDGCLFGAWCAEEISGFTNQTPSKPNRNTTILDIGTGTGLLSLMIAQKNEVRIDAIEIEPQAAKQAQNNCEASPFNGQIRVLEKDLLKLDNGPYDCIVSNPPFYENELQSGSSQKNIAHHSHQLSWKELFAAINKLLAADGVFFLLLPFKRSKELPSYLQAENLHANKIVTVQQSVHHAPFRILVKGSRSQLLIKEEQLAIWNENRQYTPEFTRLLKDYYLYL